MTAFARKDFVMDDKGYLYFFRIKNIRYKRYITLDGDIAYLERLRY